MTVTQLHLPECMAPLQGLRLRLPDDKAIRPAVLNGSYEAFELRQAVKTVRKGWVCIDVGACVGIWTLVLARCVGPTGAVYAFEPEPDNYRLLCANITGNRLDGVVSQCGEAVSDSKGIVNLYTDPDNAGNHSLLPNGTVGHPVPVGTLDDFFSDEVKFGWDGRVQFIKVDVQGAEVKVLRGAKKLISSQPSLTMVVEFCPDSLEAMGNSREELLDLLFTEFGFRVFTFAPLASETFPNGQMAVDFSKGYRLVHWTREAVLDRSKNGSPGDFSNLWCVK